MHSVEVSAAGLALSAFVGMGVQAAPRDLLVCTITASSACKSGACGAVDPSYPLVLIDRVRRTYLRCEINGFCTGHSRAELSTRTSQDIIAVPSEDIEA